MAVGFGGGAGAHRKEVQEGPKGAGPRKGSVLLVTAATTYCFDGDNHKGTFRPSLAKA